MADETSEMPPAPQPNNPNQVINQINNLFNNLDIATGTMTKTPTGIKITGQTTNNQQVTFQSQSLGHFQSNTVTTFRPTTPQERKEISKELYKQGLPQQKIADLLGVSQKTISNDVKKP